MSKNRARIRVLVAKAGLDGHDRGAMVIAASFRDAGFEVVYTGLHQTPEMIVAAAIQEDVDVVALSILSGSHMTMFPRILSLLNEEGAGHVLVTGGGVFNLFLMQQISEISTTEICVPSVEIIEYKEALIFALLGVLRDDKQVNCLSSVTGASRDHSAGEIFHP